MRTALFSSLLAALLVAVPVAASANPNAPAPAAATSGEMAAAPAMQMAEKVNINTASAEALQKSLNGIGLNKAAAIVAYREANGAFASIDELLEVSGIGKTLLERNRDRLSLE